MATYFISDLHLTPDRRAVTTLFLDFLQDIAADAESVYILGDLFEYWIGDDAVDVVGQTIAFEAIQRTAGSGIPVYFIPGNRDFLVGSGFEDQTGCRLLPDPSTITIDGARILLMHGDSLCTDDTAHQQFRSLVNDAEWQRNFLAVWPSMFATSTGLMAVIPMLPLFLGGILGLRRLPALAGRR